MLAVASSCLGLMPRLPMRSAVAPGRHALSMSAFVGPRQQEIEAKLTAAFSPLHLQVDNESHGRQEDECALPFPTQTCDPSSPITALRNAAGPTSRWSWSQKPLPTSGS